MLSPLHDPDGFKTYFDQAWQRIKFDTQDGNPLVSCHIQSEAMTCDRTSRPFRSNDSRTQPAARPEGFKTYFDDYIDKVWQRITTNGIQFDTQDGNPLSRTLRSSWRQSRGVTS